MISQPVAVGLILCDTAIVAEKTRRVTLVNILTKLRARQFPFTPPPFFAFLTLTDGLGDATIDLVGSSLADDTEVFAEQRQVAFADRLEVVQMLFRVDATFPMPAVYQFTVLVEGSWVAHCRLRVVSLEDNS